MNKEQDKEKLVNSIVKALAYTENGGKPNIKNPSAGQSGELKSIFQFEPGTWKQYSKEVTGHDNLPLDADHETYVVQQKVKKWVDEGKNASQIASLWNSGNENAYKQNHKGTNSSGIAYDTPAYAKKVVSYAKQFYTEQPPTTNIDKTGTALSTESKPAVDTDALNNVIKIIKDAGKQTASIQTQGNALVAPPNNLQKGMLGGSNNSGKA